MAHRTNITQVPNGVEISNSTEIVIDPVCGKKMTQSGSRYLLFRFDEKFYFCSRDCRDRFGRLAA